jgi:hypothetical protein
MVVMEKMGIKASTKLAIARPDVFGTTGTGGGVDGGKAAVISVMINPFRAKALWAEKLKQFNRFTIDFNITLKSM